MGHGSTGCISIAKNGCNGCNGRCNGRVPASQILLLFTDPTVVLLLLFNASVRRHGAACRCRGDRGRRNGARAPARVSEVVRKEPIHIVAIWAVVIVDAVRQCADEESEE